ncbi:uncharacterized protein BCR38DRAFT_428496 [Pseudomassariella vexata]|uniref:Uncharacterized protein n=1 Tax=Pseudomassariella vexata TaxID=1141098 RepID=A0A1Y2E317_9PEZI|nr:uncharacterized protein BCR38DRAFT_428496 [Pseudomassariella vexata]ORY65837.1 hypothetical protein BCR38DRAFT_428496 [Pseudomassariella vexata]
MSNTPMSLGRLLPQESLSRRRTRGPRQQSLTALSPQEGFEDRTNRRPNSVDIGLAIDGKIVVDLDGWLDCDERLLTDPRQLSHCTPDAFLLLGGTPSSPIGRYSDSFHLLRRHHAKTGLSTFTYRIVTDISTPRHLSGYWAGRGTTTRDPNSDFIKQRRRIQRIALGENSLVFSSENFFSVDLPLNSSNSVEDCSANW